MALEDLRGRIDVAEISSDTLGVDNVVAVDLGHQRVELEQQRERLANTTGGAEDGDVELSLQRWR